MLAQRWDSNDPHSDDPLYAFASEQPDVPDPPELPATASVEVRKPALELSAPRRKRRTRQPTSAAMGIAGLVGVAAGTVGVLIMSFGGSQPLRDLTTSASRSSSDAPPLVGSAGQIGWALLLRDPLAGEP